MIPNERDSGEYRKYRKHSGPGKGDKQRPGDIEAYREGWERIFGKKKNEPVNPAPIPNHRP